MSFLILGFLTGLSLILALGAQNIFVIEQGLKRNYIFMVCLICSVSDLILIFFGIFLFEYLKIYFTYNVKLIFNILLFIFLIYFIFNKVLSLYKKSNIVFREDNLSLRNTVIKTLGFTYLNPHVYSDTVFFLGNFSKNFLISNKYLFGLGASISSFLFFFSLGYLANYFSKNLISSKAWKIINFFIIIFMTVLSSYVFMDMISLI